MSSVFSAILYVLRREGGSLDEKELYKKVLDTLQNYDREREITFKEFNKALLSLETRGLVTVTTLKKNMRVVRLLSK